VRAAVRFKVARQTRILISPVRTGGFVDVFSREVPRKRQRLSIVAYQAPASSRT
jgi:hypothetical protein